MRFDFSRWSGALVALVVLAGAAALILVIGSNDLSGESNVAEGNLFDSWRILYDTRAPSWNVVLAAVLLAVLFASGLSVLERRVALRYRRASDHEATPLAPKIIMERTRGVFAGPVTITVLIPAHNEEESLPATLSSLSEQSHRPERVIVVADNCTDGTVDLARAAGVEVFVTVGNTQKKGGALNQALREVLPGMGANDTVMIMDADTELDPGFLSAAVARFTRDRALMSVGGLFHGEPGHGLIGQFQRNEYTRYAREMKRRRGRVFVLTGTASVFRADGLLAVAENRGGALPGIKGEVFDTAALTEDNELTIALKSLGALIISPHDCTVVTELMPTWRALWAQRLRWQRGALENLGAYGFTPQTIRYWAQQLGIGYGVIALSSYFLLFALMALALDRWVWFPFWLGLGAVFAVERVVTVWKAGWRARLLAVLVVPELMFDMFLNVVYVKGILDSALGRQASWRHVQDGDLAAELEA